MKTTAKQWAPCYGAKIILKTTDFTALYDKGYHYGSEIKNVLKWASILWWLYRVLPPLHLMNTITLINLFKPTGRYLHLSATTNLNHQWKLVSEKQTALYLFCKTFIKPIAVPPALHWHFAQKTKKGRLLERSEYQPYIEQNKKILKHIPKRIKEGRLLLSILTAS